VLADRPHEIALRHDARDLVVVCDDYDAASAMLREHFAISSNDFSVVVVKTPPPFCLRMVATFISFSPASVDVP